MASLTAPPSEQQLQDLYDAVLAGYIEPSACALACCPPVAHTIRPIAALGRPPSVPAHALYKSSSRACRAPLHSAPAHAPADRGAALPASPRAGMSPSSPSPRGSLPRPLPRPPGGSAGPAMPEPRPYSPPAPGSSMGMPVPEISAPDPYDDYAGYTLGGAGSHLRADSASCA
jgi:hypothetical protein